jgi:hypothetical protein
MTGRTESGTAPLYGRTALVTGGGSGLGRAIARSLLADGARVVITGRDEARLKETASRLGPDVSYRVCDVSRPGDVEDLARALAAEEISVLVNNAGVAGPVAPLTEIAPHEWDEVFDVNVRGVFLMCRAFLPAIADLIKVAMINVHKTLHDELPHVKMILQVHDELIFEVPDHDLEEAKRLVKSEMEDVGKQLGLSVPLKVDLGVGKNWRVAHP